MATELNATARASIELAESPLAAARGSIAVAIVPAADGIANHPEVLASDPKGRV